jgi:hypothetical protein
LKADSEPKLPSFLWRPLKLLLLKSPYHLEEMAITMRGEHGIGTDGTVLHRT